MRSIAVPKMIQVLCFAFWGCAATTAPQSVDESSLHRVAGSEPALDVVVDEQTLDRLEEAQDWVSVVRVLRPWAEESIPVPAVKNPHLRLGRAWMHLEEWAKAYPLLRYDFPREEGDDDSRFLDFLADELGLDSSAWAKRFRVMPPALGERLFLGISLRLLAHGSCGDFEGFLTLESVQGLGWSSIDSDGLNAFQELCGIQKHRGDGPILLVLPIREGLAGATPNHVLRTFNMALSRGGSPGYVVVDSSKVEGEPTRWLRTKVLEKKAGSMLLVPRSAEEEASFVEAVSPVGLPVGVLRTYESAGASPEGQVVSLSMSSSVMLSRLLFHLKSELGVSTLTIVESEDQVSGAWTETEALAEGITDVELRHVSLSEGIRGTKTWIKSFRSLVSKDKVGVLLPFQPRDVLHVLPYFQASGVPLCLQPSQGKCVQLLGTSMWANERIIDVAGDLTNNAIIASSFDPSDPAPVAREFASLFRSQFAQKPTAIEAEVFSLTRILVDYVRTMKTAAPALALQEWLVEQSPRDTALGLVSFLADGKVVREAALLTVRDGVLRTRLSEEEESKGTSRP